MPEEDAAFRRYKRPVRFLAMRFAAKEAIVKAMGTGFAHGIWIRDVGVSANAWGRPEVIWSERGRALRDRLGAGRRTRDADRRGWPHVAVAVLDATRSQSDSISNVFAFDIETVPDVEFGRRLHGLDGLSDEQVGNAMQTRQREQTGSEFLPLEQHRVVAISVALRTREGFRAWSLGEADSTEGELVRRFFDGIERSRPTLVSWNGGGFDLPVLHYRAMRHRVQAHRYWETGDEDQSFRYNNYLGRFHWRHIDLMDVLSGYQARGRVGLDRMALLLGLPGQARHVRAQASGTPTSRAAATPSAITARPTSSTPT